jgi:hypothetical protein
MPGTLQHGAWDAAFLAEPDVQRVATAMLKFGVLSPRYATVVGQGTLVRSMVSPG